MARPKKPKQPKVHYGSDNNILCHYKSDVSTFNIRDVTCKECKRKYKEHKKILEIIN